MGVRASHRRLLLLVALLALTAWASPLMGTTNSSAQDTPTVGVDADPTGNDATSLEAIDSCVSVSKGDTFQVDIFVADIAGLLGWEVHFRYDPSLVTIVDRDVQMFLAASPGSEVSDFSEPLPDSTGRHRMAAIDMALPRSPESGSGVLTRLTLQAIASGISPAELAEVDRDGNGTLELGTILSDELSRPIPPSDPQDFFAGPTVNAAIAVDNPCSAVTPVPATATPVPATPSPAESPTPGGTSPALTPSPSATAETPSPTTTPVATRTATPTTTAAPTATPTVSGPDSDGNGPPWVIIALAAGLGGAVILLAGGAVLMRARRGGAG